MRVLYILLMTVAVAFGIYRFTKTENNLIKAITLFLGIGIILTFVLNLFTVMIGTFAFILGVFLAILYGITKPNSDMRHRLSLLLISIPVFLYYTAGLINWGNGDYIRFVMIVPVGAYVYILLKRKNYVAEIGFVTIMAADALLRLLMI